MDIQNCITFIQNFIVGTYLFRKRRKADIQISFFLHLYLFGFNILRGGVCGVGVAVLSMRGRQFAKCNALLGWSIQYDPRYHPMGDPALATWEYD